MKHRFFYTTELDNGEIILENKITKYARKYKTLAEAEKEINAHFLCYSYCIPIFVLYTNNSTRQLSRYKRIIRDEENH